jgi:hypothetical protein
LITYGIGAAIVLKQAGIFFDPPSQISATLILFSGTMMGIPGLRQLAEIIWPRLTGSSRSQPPADQSSDSSSGQ